MSSPDRTARARWRRYVLVGVLIAVVLVFLVWLGIDLSRADSRWRETAVPVFEESVRSVSKVLGTPDSPAIELAWHEGPGVQGSECDWVRRASWPLGDTDPADPIGRLETVVVSLTGMQLLNSSSTGGEDWHDLEGATSLWSMRGAYEIWLEAHIEDGERFRLVVYGGAC